MTTLAINITTNAAQAAAQLRGAPKRMIAGIKRALDEENQYTKGHIETAKLSVRGPKTLGVRSNRLRESVNATKAVAVADGITSSIGSNVKYAGVHERGFTGTVQVSSHRRKFSAFDVHSRGPRGGRGKKVASGVVFVRAHAMKMNLPAREMFRTGIEERTQNYAASVSAAIVAAWQGGAS